ncbi:MAG TPA: AMIN domain-containing protein [Myxococcales bacterium]
MSRAPFFAFIFGVSFAALAQEGRLVAVRPGGDAMSSAVELIGNRPLSFTTLELQSPPRIVVDFADTVVGGAPAEVSVEDGTVRTVATAAAGAHTARVVIELVADAEFDVRAKGNAVVVRIPRIAPRVAGERVDDARAAVAQNAPPNAATAMPDAGAAIPDAAVAENAPRDGGVESEAEKRASLPTVSLVGSRPAELPPTPPTPPEPAKKAADRTEAERKSKAEARKAAAERASAAAKSAAEHRARVAADRRAAVEKAAAEKKAAAERRATEKRAAADKLAAEKKAAAEHRAAVAAEKRAAAEKLAVEKKAAAERRAAVAIEKRAAAEKAAADKKAAAEQRASDKRAAAQQAAAEAAAARTSQAGEKAAARARAAEAAAIEKRAAEQRAAEDRRVAAEKAAAAKKARATAAAEAAARKSAAEQPPPLLTPEEAKALREAAERGLPTGLGPAPETTTQANPPPPKQRRVARADGGKGRIAIHSIGFRPSGGGELVVRSEKPLGYGITGEERAVLLHLAGATIPRHGDRLPLDTHFFEGPVLRVVPVETATGVDLRIELRARAEYQVSQDGDVLTVAFSAAR